MTREQHPFVDLSSVETKTVSWLLEPLIPLGMISIMEGDPGVGKSYLAMHIAAQVSAGGHTSGRQQNASWTGPLSQQRR